MFLYVGPSQPRGCMHSIVQNPDLDRTHLFASRSNILVPLKIAGTVSSVKNGRGVYHGRISGCVQRHRNNSIAVPPTPPPPTPPFFARTNTVHRIAFRFVVNLTMGLFMAVFQFLFSMWTVIWSYQPDPLSTLAFAAMAALGAVSMLATWLLGLAAVGVTGVYTVAKLAETAQVKRNVHGDTSDSCFVFLCPWARLLSRLMRPRVKRDGHPSDFFFLGDVGCVFPSKVLLR